MAQQFFLGVAEHLLGPGVGQHDVPIAVDNHDGVRRGIQENRQCCLQRLQRFPRPCQMGRRYRAHSIPLGLSCGLACGLLLAPTSFHWKSPVQPVSKPASIGTRRPTCRMIARFESILSLGAYVAAPRTVCQVVGHLTVWKITPGGARSGRVEFGRGKPTFPGRGGPWRGWFLIAAGQSCVTNVASPIPSAPRALAAIRTAACRISVEVQRLRLRWRTPVADGWRRRNTTPSHSSYSGTRFQNVKKNR